MAAAGERWSRWRVRVGYPVGVICYLLARPTPRSLAMGAAIAALGLVWRAAAAGRLSKYERLATSGPYACTRNPLYFGSALLAAGFLLAGRSWIAAAASGAYFLLFYGPVMRREERELRERYGRAFDDYAARVPLFWPRWPSRSKSRGPGGDGFSWSLYLRNREYRAALGFLLVAGLFWWKMYRGW